MNTKVKTCSAGASYLILTITLLLQIGTVHGAVVCNTIQDCRALKDQAEARIEALTQNSGPYLTAIAKNSDGTVRHMNQNEAALYCLSQGLRLPNVIELAQYAKKSGAEGIIETNPDGAILHGTLEWVTGYDLRAPGHPGPVYGFYYSNKGYNHLGEDLQQYAYLSSTIRDNYVYVLRGETGKIDGYNITRSFVAEESAVRCLRTE